VGDKEETWYMKSPDRQHKVLWVALKTMAQVLCVLPKI